MAAWNKPEEMLAENFSKGQGYPALENSMISLNSTGPPENLRGQTIEDSAFEGRKYKYHGNNVEF